MEAFVKSFLTYRTIKKSTVLSSALVLDSLENDTGSVTVKGVDINRSDTGNWLIVDGNIYLIQTVKPQSDRTLLTVASPLEAFNRPLEYAQQTSAKTIGNFLVSALRNNWIQETDPTYAMPYLSASTSDTTKFVAPELDSDGLFQLPEYCRLMRKAYRVRVRFQDAGDRLECTIAKTAAASRRVAFDDGRSQLKSVDYSSSGTAKLTVLQDIDTGEKDENGEAITRRERSVWYLAEDGSVSESVPSRRASGGWDTIVIKGKDEVQDKVVEAFAKNKANHKLEFYSTRDLSVHDDCLFMVYGEPLSSYISYKRKESEDRRFYYKSGELAVSATEKLRGVLK